MTPLDPALDYPRAQMDVQNQTDVLLGRVLDEKYQIERLLGRGGMGRVYFARHVGTGRPVAVKVILEGLLQNAEAVARFRREAQAAGSIRHPNVVDVTDFGVTRDVASPRTAYLVMEYLDGQTLKQLLDDEQRLPLASAVDVVEQIALALEEAHRRSIVHRDLKPDNIWLVPDPRGGFVVKVLDFGVAALIGSEVRTDARPAIPSRGEGGAVLAAEDGSAATTLRSDPDTAIAVLEEDAETAVSAPASDATEVRTGGTSGQKLTLMGSAIGTPAYMSPEQCRGEPVDARSDLYALGLVAFEMLTGRRAFEGSRAEVVRQHISETPPRADALLPGLPSKVADVIARSLSKDPAARHPSASAFAGSLRVAAEGATVTLRRAVSLYSDRLDQFLSILFRACRPLVPIAVLLLVVALAAVPFATNKIVGAWLQAVIGTGALLLWMLITLWSHSLFAFVVDELRVRPLGKLSYDSVAERLANRTGIALTSGFLSRSWKLMVFYFTCERHAPAGTGDLSFLVAALEGREPKDAGNRCRVLAPAVAKTYTWVRMSIIISMIFLPALETAFVCSVMQAMKISVPRLLPTLLFPAFMPLNSLWITPIFSIALALVYYRSRQAEGEDVSLGAIVSTRL